MRTDSHPCTVPGLKTTAHFTGLSMVIVMEFTSQAFRGTAAWCSRGPVTLSGTLPATNKVTQTTIKPPFN